MPENWNAIAAEVDEAIRSVADVAGGYPAAIEMPPAGAPANAWDPPSGSPTYHTVYCLEGVREIRDAAGTTILRTMRTLMISATGPAPAKGQRIAVGVSADDADEDSPWQEIEEVRPLAPAGVAVLYEVDLLS